MIMLELILAVAATDLYALFGLLRQLALNHVSNSRVTMDFLGNGHFLSANIF
jgi:hypothetical protein